MQAIYEAAIRSGHCGKDAQLDSPTLLMLLEDMANDICERQKHDVDSSTNGADTPTLDARATTAEPQATKAVNWPVISEKIRNYILEYEFRGDSIDHRPTEFEKVMLEDFSAGVLDVLEDEMPLKPDSDRVVLWAPTPEQIVWHWLATPENERQAAARRMLDKGFLQLGRRLELEPIRPPHLTLSMPKLERIAAHAVEKVYDGWKDGSVDNGVVNFGKACAITALTTALETATTLRTSTTHP